MFKKRKPKAALKRCGAAGAGEDGADEEEPTQSLEEVQNAQYWRKRHKGLSAETLAAAPPEKSQAAKSQAEGAALAPSEAPEMAANETIEKQMEKKYAGASGERSAQAAMHEAALAEYIAERTGASQEAVEQAPLSAEDALYVVPPLEGVAQLTKDAETARQHGGGLQLGATGVAEVEMDAKVAEANARRTARVVADLDRKRAADRLAVSSALLPEDRDRALPPRATAPAPEEDLKGKRGPHLWQRGTPAEERRKALAKSRVDRCGGARILY